MKLVATLVAAATLALPAAWAKAPKPVLGIDWNDRTGARLAWFDPSTLKLAPGHKVLLAGHALPWSYSPDRSKLVLAGDDASLRFVDTKRMRLIGDLRLGLATTVRYVHWVRSDRVLVLGESKEDESVVVVVDAARRTVVRTLPLDARAPAGAVGFSGGLAVLLADVLGRTPPALAVVDGQGAVRTTSLDGISASRAGFAVDTSASRAFVIDGDLSAAEIRLGSLAVSYHRSSTRSLAKFFPGPARVARWLGGGILAVSGADYQGEPATPVGLSLIDTRTWTWRTIDPSVASFEVGSGIVVGTGSAFEAGPKHYSAYGVDGSPRYSVDVPDGQSLVVQGRYAYVCRGRGLMRVLDARTGSVLRRYRGTTLPICATLLYGRSSSGTLAVAPV